VAPVTPTAPVNPVSPTTPTTPTTPSNPTPTNPPGQLLPGSGGDTHTMPTTGMFFLHPDHLGSVSMVTDANGNYLGGMNLASGESKIKYAAYGEIKREDSSGPDILRYKYTGQEEDYETGLYYYKARFYDPGIGRFLQADSMMDTSSAAGMNLYMYVDGNPIKNRDPSGNNAFWHMFGQIVKGILKAGDYKNFTAANAAGGVKWAGTSIGNGAKKIGTDIGNGAIWISKAPSQAKYNEAIGRISYNYLTSDMTPEEFLKLYFLSSFLSGYFNKTDSTWFGGNYSGPGGNLDQFQYFTQGPANDRGFKMLGLMYLASQFLGIDYAKTLSFMFMMKDLRAQPNSQGDLLGFHHDMEVPGANLIDGRMTSEFPNYSLQHMRADFNYMGRSIDMIVHGRGNALDVVQAVGGSIILGVDAFINFHFITFGVFL
jgi:RHS repeat-associated protein